MSGVHADGASATGLASLAKALRDGAGIAGKREIAGTLGALGVGARDPVAVGDDCAAIPMGDVAEGEHVLFAIEGFIPALVEAEPFFAGWCGVMVNVSDIAAMGGRPVAVVDALWARDAGRARPILEGLRAAADAFGVPVVGGHTNTRCAADQLAVAVIGRARRLITSFDARPGDALVAAIDLRGRYHEPNPFFDAATGAPPERLRGDVALLAGIAEAGLAHAGKDISQGGIVGTLLMLLEASGVGARLDLRAIPRPEGEPIERWLAAFPSFGHLLATGPDRVEALIARFAARDIAAACVGEFDESGALCLREGSEVAQVWSFDESPLIGCGALAAEGARHA